MDSETKQIVTDMLKECANVAVIDTLYCVQKAFEYVEELKIPIAKEVNGTVISEGYREPTVKELCTCMKMFLSEFTKTKEKELHEKHKD